MTQRSLRSTALLALFVCGGVAIWYFGWLRRTLDVEQLVPVVRESRLPLLFELERASQGYGFPEHLDFLAVNTDKDRNLDDASLPFWMPTAGEVTFRDLAVHADAAVEFGYSIEGVAVEQGANRRVVFSVRARDARGSDHPLFEDALTTGPVGSAQQRKWARAVLPGELVGERVSLVFATAAPDGLPSLAALPAFLSPVLASAGVKVRLESLRQDVVVLLHDLVAEHPRAVEADEEFTRIVVPTLSERPVAEWQVFAVRWDGDPANAVPSPIPFEASGASPSFVADDRSGARLGGAMPALFFDRDGVIARYPIDVPSDGAALQFYIGVDARSAGVGAARFRIHAGERELYEELLDPAAVPAHRGFHRRALDLAPYRGQRIVLTFAGETLPRSPETLDGQDEKPLPPFGARYRLEVRGVRAAFGRPRVVQLRSVPRRLAAIDRPSVVFVNIETLRADAVSCYASGGAATPELDRLAADGTRVEECITVAPWTAPSVASVFTGLYPQSHGVTAHARSFLVDGLETLAERAQAAGVTTVAVSTNDAWVSERKNFDQGFESFLLAPYANARQVVATFADWLADHRDLQFFAYLHLFDPHHPYNAPGADLLRYVPERLRGMDPAAALARVQEAVGAAINGAAPAPAPESDDVQLLRGLYLGEVHYLDRQLGRLREALVAAGLERRVVIVVCSDHGEEFCEHGLIGHGSHCYVESVKVPLVFWGPGGSVPRGKVLDGPVENASLYATILELLRAPYDREAVRPAIRLDGERAGGAAYSSTDQGVRRVAPPDLFLRSWHSLRTRTSSLVFSRSGVNPDEVATFRLFDRASDPLERVDRSATDAAGLARMQDALRRAYGDAIARRLGLDFAAIAPSAAAAMQQLGYVAATLRESEDDDLFAPPPASAPAAEPEEDEDDDGDG